MSLFLSLRERNCWKLLLLLFPFVAITATSVINDDNDNSIHLNEIHLYIASRKMLENLKNQIYLNKKKLLKYKEIFSIIKTYIVET